MSFENTFQSRFIGEVRTVSGREFKVVGPATIVRCASSKFEESSSRCRLMNGDVDVRGYCGEG